MTQENIKNTVEENTEEGVFRDVEEATEETSEEAVQENEAKIKCSITAAITEDGAVFLNFDGSEQHIITLQGLVGYASKYVDKMWEEKMNQGK